MQEIGKVEKVENGFATVRVDKKEECSKCGMCLFSSGANHIDIKAENKIGANVGDTVIFDNSGSGKTLGIVLVFLVPLLLIGVATLLGLLVIKRERWVLILSLIFLVCWLLILSAIDKKLKTKSSFTASIIKVIDITENTENTENIQINDREKGDDK